MFSPSRRLRKAGLSAYLVRSALAAALSSSTAVTALLEHLKQATEAIGALEAIGDRHAGDFPKVATALRAACEHGLRRIEAEEVTVLLAGTEPVKRAFLDALAGDPLFATAPREAPGATTIEIRRGTSLRYVARMVDGSTEDFARDHPDRAPRLQQSLRQARIDADAASVASVALERRLALVERDLEAPPLTAEARDVARSWPAGMWISLVSWVLGLFGRRDLLLPPPSRARGGAEVEAKIARRDLQRALEEAQANVASARSRAERLEKEADEHRYERTFEFLRAIRALTSAGDRVAELSIEITSPRLPSDFVIVDAPAARWRALREKLGACLLVDACDPDPAEVVAPVGVLPVDVARVTGDLGDVFDRVREQAPFAALAVTMADLPPRIHSLAKAAAGAEAECRARIDALERERLPAPEAFRAEQLDRMSGAIDDGARRVLERAKERLHAKLIELESEWTNAIGTCKDRASLATCIGQIDAGAPARVRALVESLGEDVGGELQSASETLQVWVLEEVRRQYRTRYMHVDTESVVITELPSEEVASIGAPLLGAAVVRFQRRRIGIGLGGALIGAAIGTVLWPIVGTVLGALVGLLASFLQRRKVLATWAVSRIHAYLANVETAIGARLEGSCESFARDIRAAVDDTIGSALKRRDQSILRLIDLEAESLERQRQKLEEVTGLREALEEQEARFAELADAAATALRERSLSPSRT